MQVEVTWREEEDIHQDMERIEAKVVINKCNKEMVSITRWQKLMNLMM